MPSHLSESGNRRVILVVVVRERYDSYIVPVFAILVQLGEVKY
jgi:hypothetical protein